MKHITARDLADFANSKFGHYDYYDARNCPLAQYAREMLSVEFPIIVRPINFSICDENDHNKIVATYEPEIEQALLKAGGKVFGKVDKWSALSITLAPLAEPVGIHLTADDTTKKLEHLT